MARQSKRAAAIGLLSALSILWLPVAQAADLTVTLSGVETSKGEIIVCLWRSKKDFPLCAKDIPDWRTAEAADGASVTFEGLEPGAYAVSAFHDKDGNGKLKQNFIGIPKEPVTVSGPKQKRMGPPKFSGAVFEVEGDMDLALVFE